MVWQDSGSYRAGSGYSSYPLVIGLTGSIAMGKSTVTSQFARLGAKTCSADDIVHRLLGPGGAAVEQVGKLFPGVAKSGAVVREKLGKEVFGDPEKLRQLEEVLHPLVIDEEEKFVKQQAQLGAKLVVMDIPLLFETGGEDRCDATVVVSAPYYIQKQRVMQREGMTEGKFHDILKRQMKDSEKRKRADWVVETGLGKAYSFSQVKEIITELFSGKCL